MALFLSLSTISFLLQQVTFLWHASVKKKLLSLTLPTCFIAYYNLTTTKEKQCHCCILFWSILILGANCNFRTRNHCRLIEWIIMVDYSLYSYSSKRWIICTLDLKHRSPNLFLYFPNNGYLSIMIIYPENAKPHRIPTSLPTTPYMKDNKSTVKPQQENLHAINLFNWEGGKGKREIISSVNKFQQCFIWKWWMNSKMNYFIYTSHQCFILFMIF